MWSRLKKHPYLSQALIGVIILGSLYQTLCHTEAFADDAAISFSYSRNLAYWGEFTHTASSERVEGFSNPTWTVLCALPFLMGMDPYIFTRAVGIMCLLGMILLVFRLLKIICPRSALARYVATLFVGMVPCVGFWTVAGLETPLIGFLVALLLYQVVCEEREPDRTHLSGITLALLALSRPEGIMYAFPVFAYKFIRFLFRPREERRAWFYRHLLNFGFVLVPVALFFGWRKSYFSAWLPNTFYAKLGTVELVPIHPEAVDEKRAHFYIKGFFRLNHLWEMAYASPLSLFVRGSLFETLFLLAFTLLHLAFVYAVDGDWMGDFRFFAMVIPAWGAVLALTIQGGGDLIAQVGRWIKDQKIEVVSGWVVSSTLAVLFLVYSFWPTLVEYERQGWVRMEVVRRQGTNLELLARRTGLMKAKIAVPDVGGSALFSNVNILDTVGLVDPVIARSKNRPSRIRDYFFEEARPDFLQQHTLWRRYYNFLNHYEFERDYVLLPETSSKRLGLLGENYMRREHFNGYIAEAEHRLTVDLGGGFILRGYDAPIKISRDRYIFRLFVETLGQQPETGHYITVAVRQGQSSDEQTAMINMTDLPTGVFLPGMLLRLRASVRSESFDHIQFRGVHEGSGSPWISLRSANSGQDRQPDLERYILHPRTHFACRFPPNRWSPDLRARGRLQIFDACTPYHDRQSVNRMSKELLSRANNAHRSGQLRAAMRLLDRAELLEPRSEQIHQAQKKVALRAFRRSRKLAARGKLRSAHFLLTQSLRADPLLSQARALDFNLVGKGLTFFPDARERAVISDDRLGRTGPTDRSFRELITAMFETNRSLEAARIITDWNFRPRDPSTTLLVAQAMLSQGLCGRSQKLLETLSERPNCQASWLLYKSQVMCGSEKAKQPSCSPEPASKVAKIHPIFEFEEGWEENWEVSEPLIVPDEQPVHYVSGFSGIGLLRTDHSLKGRKGHYRATSPTFKIRSPGLSIQVGGGSEQDGVRVELLIGSKVIHKGFGRRDYHLRRVTWNVSEFIGREAKLRIIDEGRGEWGHIMIDHVREHPLHFFDPMLDP